MSAIWHRASGRTRAGRPDLDRFVADLRSMPLDAGPFARNVDGVGPFLLALASYVVAGVVLKGVVLNWIVGPLYLVTVLHAVPTAGRTLMAVRR